MCPPFKELEEDLSRILSATHAEKSELRKKALYLAFKAARKLKDKLGENVIRQTTIILPPQPVINARYARTNTCPPQKSAWWMPKKPAFRLFPSLKHWRLGSLRRDYEDISLYLWLKWIASKDATRNHVAIQCSSFKDVGTYHSMYWTLYKAQQQLTAIGDGGVKVTFFTVVSGTVGRGDGLLAGEKLYISTTVIRTCASDWLSKESDWKQMQTKTLLGHSLRMLVSAAINRMITKKKSDTNTSETVTKLLWIK